MLKSSIPKPSKQTAVRKTVFKGLYKTDASDCGYLSCVSGVDLSESPVLKGARSWELFYTFPKTEYPQSIARIGDHLIVFCRMLTESASGNYYQDDAVNIVAVKHDGSAYIGAGLHYRESGDTSVLPSDYNNPRSIVQYNVYHSSGALADAVGGRYDKKILIFPDKMSIDYEITGDGFSLTKLDADAPLPNLLYVTVHAARLFGVDANRIYASAYNDASDWDVDTAEDISAQNAWVSTSAANTRADSDFTAICEYGGTVFAFKRDYVHQITGNKNPFRIRDFSTSGAIDFRSIAQAADTLFYVSADGVKAYSGNVLREIGKPLGIQRFQDGICGGFRDTYYLYEGGVIYTYHAPTGMWSAISPPDENELVCFAAGDDALYCLTCASPTESYLYRLSGAPAQWWFETDLATFASFDVKRIAKLSLLCEISAGARVRAYLLRDGEQMDAQTSLCVLDSAGRTGACSLRTCIRAGASHGHRLRVECTGEVRIRGLELTAFKEADSFGAS